MSTEADTSTPNPIWQRRPLLWFAGALVGLLLLTAVLLSILRGCAPTASSLSPTLPSPTPVPQVIPAVPEVVTFTALNADPFQYLNQRIRVSGDLLFPDLPDCSPYSGPQFRWALVAEQLQLDARNFPQVMRQVAAGTPLTIEGIWRLYQGPLGCGKGAPRGSAWYLDVQRIIQPNPLYSVDGVVILIEDGVPSFPGSPGEGAAPTAVPDQPAAPPTVTATAVPANTVEPFVTPSLTPPPNGTPTTTATATLFPIASATPPNSGTTPTATQPPGATAVPTSTLDPAVTPTLTAEPPPLTTATPGGGYPAPSTPPPTASPTSYPTN